MASLSSSEASLIAKSMEDVSIATPSMSMEDTLLEGEDPQDNQDNASTETLCPNNQQSDEHCRKRKRKNTTSMETKTDNTIDLTDDNAKKSTKLALLARGKLNRTPADSIVQQSKTKKTIVGSSQSPSTSGTIRNKATMGGSNNQLIKPSRLASVDNDPASKTKTRGVDESAPKRTWGQIVEDSFRRKPSMAKTTNATTKKMSDPDIPKYFTKEYASSSKDMCTLSVQTCRDGKERSAQDDPKDRLPLNDAEEKLFKQLRNAQEKLMRYRLHKEYLTQYLNEGLVPKGLKLTAEPFLGKPDDTLDHEWTEILEAASYRLLEITIDKVELSIRDLDRQWLQIVDEIDDSISQLSTKEAIICKVADLVCAKEQTLRESKNRKLTRDRQGTSKDKQEEAAPIEPPTAKRRKTKNQQGKKFNKNNKHQRSKQRQQGANQPQGGFQQHAQQWNQTFAMNHKEKMDFVKQFMNMLNKN